MPSHSVTGQGPGPEQVCAGPDGACGLLTSCRKDFTARVQVTRRVRLLKSVPGARWEDLEPCLESAQWGKGLGGMVWPLGMHRPCGGQHVLVSESDVIRETACARQNGRKRVPVAAEGSSMC